MSKETNSPNDPLEHNVRELLSAMQPNLTMPESKKAEILSALLAETATTARQEASRGDDSTITQDPTQPAVRRVPDVPTDQADGVSRETHPIEQPPGRRHVSRRFVAMFQKRAVRWSFVAAAAAAVVLAIGLWPGKPGPRPNNGTAWAMDLPIAALQSIRSAHITGMSRGYRFDCWLRCQDGERGVGNLRYKSNGDDFFMQAGIAYDYDRRRNEVHTYKNFELLQCPVWGAANQLKLWLDGTLYEQIKTNGQDLHIISTTDEQTANACVEVTCSYPPANCSFWLLFDAQTSLLTKARFWWNTSREGPPLIDADNINYNETMADDVFAFTIPEGATVVDSKARKEQQALFDQAEQLYKDKKYAEAINVYQSYYERYPKTNNAESALMMIGICLDRLDRKAEAIQALEKATREYPDLKGWSEATYFYLGSFYLDNGEPEKALPTYKRCLELAEGIRDPNRFPCKEAREAIAQIEKQGPEVMKARRTLLNTAEQLYKDGKFAEAIPVYTDIAGRYPQWNDAAHASMMIGLCYEKMGQNDKALAALEMAAAKYPDLKGWSEATYYYLGDRYLAAGHRDKAVDAFRKCLKLSEGVRDPNGFPAKDARKALQKLGTQP
jgi:TolA-binding protein